MISLESPQNLRPAAPLPEKDVRDVFSPASWEEIKSSWEMADFVGMLKAPCKNLARGFFVV